MVELYLSSEVSYRELALSQGINNPSLITRWINNFRIAAPDALRPKKKGRKKTLDTRKLKKPSQSNEEKPVDTSAEHIKELEDENLKLRIENAFPLIGKASIEPRDYRVVFFFQEKLSKILDQLDSYN